jgi:hypothetical protein
MELVAFAKFSFFIGKWLGNSVNDREDTANDKKDRYGR